MNCAATWPIKDVGERNYAVPCPSLWRLESKEIGICAAPATYNGPCQTRFDFTNYDAEMKKGFEGRCKVRATRNNPRIGPSRSSKAFFPISAFTVLPKLQPLIVSKRFKREATGPIGPAATKFHGAVVPPNGAIYLPSRSTSLLPSMQQSPPKTPDITASRASATAYHIKKLHEIRHAVLDQQLSSIIQVCRMCRACMWVPHATSPQDTIQELANQGGANDIGKS